MSDDLIAARLRSFLAATVPLILPTVAQHSPERLRERATELADRIIRAGDVLLYGGVTSDGLRAEMVAMDLAEAVAILTVWSHPLPLEVFGLQFSLDGRVLRCQP